MEGVSGEDGVAVACIPKRLGVVFQRFSCSMDPPETTTISTVLRSYLHLHETNMLQ